MCMSAVSFSDFPLLVTGLTDQSEGWALIAIRSGEAAVCIQGNSCLLQAGELLLLPPDSYHTIQPSEPEALVQLHFNCVGPGVVPLSRRIFSADPACLDLLLQEAAGAQPDRLPILVRALELQLMLCLRQTGISADIRAIPTKLSHQHDWIIHQVLDDLNCHYDQRITLELLANRHDISVTQLKRLFKAQTGTTVIAYLTARRMDAAKALIRAGQLNFTQIATAVGYDNIYYFSTQFKKQTGMTPTEYADTARM